MRSWTAKGLFLMLSLLLAVPMPAAAQDNTQGKLGVGLSFFNDDGNAVGFTVDYSKPFRSMANNRTLGWVGDFSFHRFSEDDLGFDDDANLISIQGGVRIGGPVGQNAKLTWHGQGLLGMIRASAAGDAGDVCDEIEDADCSDSRFIFSPGGGIDYALNERTAVRAQLDFHLGDDISATRFWIGISHKIGQ